MTQPAAASDKVTLWGVLGIIFSICCWPLGLVFDVLGMMEAKKVGKPPTLAYIGFGLAALFAVLSIINFATGMFYSFNQ
jgi:hypothetical protein